MIPAITGWETVRAANSTTHGKGHEVREHLLMATFAYFARHDRSDIRAQTLFRSDSTDATIGAFQLESVSYIYACPLVLLVWAN